MKPKMRSKRARCLFCFGNCSELQASSLFKEEIPGAVHCTTLKRQLLSLFILRNILDIDASWCEETLRRRTEAEEEFNLQFAHMEESPVVINDTGNLEFWFKLCQNCILKVEEAWKLHQKLLGIQSRMKLIKDEIKEAMKEGVRENEKRRNGSVEDDIRNAVFPEPEQGSETNQDFFDDDVILLSSDNGDNNDDDFIPQQMEREENQEEQIKSAAALTSGTPGVFRFRRKQSRPPGSLNVERRHRRKRSGHPGPSLNQTKGKWWLCQQCDVRYREDNQEKIQTHLERHKKSDETGGGEFDCPQCSFPAQDCLELDVHIRVKHIASLRKRLNTYDCPKESCDFRGRFRKAMLEHTREHHPELNLTEEDFGRESNIPCSQCPRVFTTSSSLARHQRAVHPRLIGAEQEELQCQECDLKFSSKIFLQSHINNTHKKDDHRFVCDDCGMGFPFLSRLNSHKIAHTNKTKREHVCHICGVDYAHKDIFMRHLREIHGDADNVADREVVKCRYCEFETPFRPAMMRHMETHKQEMGFKCDKCSRCYTNAQGLKRHQRINHGDTKVPCPYCNRKYPSIEYMNEHVKKYCKMKELKDQEQQQQNNSCSNSGDFKFQVAL